MLASVDELEKGLDEFEKVLEEPSGAGKAPLYKREVEWYDDIELGTGYEGEHQGSGSASTGGSLAVRSLPKVVGRGRASTGELDV